MVKGVRPTRAGRLWDYCREMFPPALMVPSGVASFLAVHWGLQALAGIAPIRLTWRTVPGAMTVVLVMLLLRLQDEEKDAARDRDLGRAGDTRFAARPTVTGIVTPDDLRALRRAVLAALLLLNVGLGTPWPLLAFAGLMLVVWLSSRWFFWPSMAENLLLAFVTHNPIALLVSCYVASVFVRDLHARLSWMAAPLLLGQWLPVAAWEIGRKIRIRDEETDYRTYSKLLGLRVAAPIPAIGVAASALLLTWLAPSLGLGLAYVALLQLGMLLVLLRVALLLRAPTPARTRLRPFIEGFALLATAGLAIALAARHGLAVG